MRIGIIGLGNICEKAYLPVITAIEGIEIVFCTRNKERLNSLSKKYRINEAVSTIDELINMNIDAAFVHTATESHIEIIEKLLNNNIHVYVDKPISYSYEDSIRVSNLAKEVNKILMVGFNRRFAPMYSNLKNYGTPSVIKLEKNRVNSPKDPVVFVLDDFIHVIDTLRFLMDEEIESINVNGLKRDGLIYNVVVTMTSKNTTCIAMMNRDSGANEEELEYTSSGKKVIVRNLIDSKVLIKNVEENKSFKDWDTILYRRGFENIINEFINSVKLGVQATPTIEDALKTHKICDEILNKINEI
ncbi:Gfo/Idh/MocA family oxidoreductase [Clostridium tertium]|jgi:virulence factor|uniref:Gfo/Idh/MocA family oxidoreductase n=1 Tax=Clostridium tertium TaxID=1559 RepID=A0A9X3XMV8_9CLOT|nr:MULTISPECIES: Gfo/Idh/MocA family oxidoreductase [Clostridium]MBU6137008.1 Gfo/Idh/MocA family oxidoreductase [Clostridium tertium]MDB1933550.1 Gfo/Idh/MocA family oxidoreductase [Clostridium tertium]MDB1936241.1 Gfo/Idh/MocA family oxidoreductase [Clostridium tertium]MDB1942086.1 Gfo/Idh/MocA family oxidoreductase [Clostridium tertium]MDB1947437.1 Gfo/Idh/MocA family oxidoreductase [Clostridium tertium]